ncbi:putative Galactose/lactose metabolism regulatory protein GAL80 [Glarea lozoyensis 74030]|uniref:Putative Galactose/lactose metabolism regulatory protein GAL80 n=1 Tax=Glarea lozoyensis (strain ATCC 74030 / MF5533) TaxID=1104152 RepID=H0EPS6_GLAL7|nr:putative Galactose/lactose metabolism regulatory protein GAL80 [Glarea lozoyensis 74030]
MSPPTRVAFIGLSASAWWAAAAHLPYLKSSPDYEIVALCNSSVEKARAAIEKFELGRGVRAYGDVEAHHSTAIIPSIKAGKNVYVEWPLGHSLADAQSLLELKNSHNITLANVGLQALLGYGFTTPPKTLLQTRRPTLKITGKDGSVVDEAAKMETPDTIFLHGTLKSEVPLSMTFRTGAPFPGTPGLDWRIAGEEGEIRITAGGAFLQIGYEDAKVEVVRGGKVESFKMEAVELHKVLEEAWKGNGYPV